MAKTIIRVKVSPGKSRGGTIVARQIIKLNKADKPKGKPVYQTRAQIAIRITTANGEQRR